MHGQMLLSHKVMEATVSVIISHANQTQSEYLHLKEIPDIPGVHSSLAHYMLAVSVLAWINNVHVMITQCHCGQLLVV